MTPTCIHKYFYPVQCKISMRRNWTEQLLTDFSCNSSDKGQSNQHSLEFADKITDIVTESRVKHSNPNSRVDKLDVTVTERDCFLWQSLWDFNRELKLLELSSLLPSREPPQLPVVSIVCEPHFWSNHDDSSVHAEKLTIIPLCSFNHRHSYAAQYPIRPITK